MCRSLRTTTGLVTSLALMAQGAPVMAQETMLACPDGTQLLCPEASTSTPQPEAGSSTEAPSEGSAAQPESDPSLAPEGALQPNADASEPASAPQTVLICPDETDLQCPKAPEPMPPSEAGPAEEVPDTGAVVDDPAAAAEPLIPTTPEAAIEPTPEPSGAPVADAPTAEPPAVTTEPAPAESGAAATDPAPDAPTAESPTAEDLEGALKAEEAAEGAPAEPVLQPSPENPPPLPLQPDVMTGQAPVAEAIQMLAPAADGAAPAPADAPAPAEAVAQVTEEIVTAESARSSTEDFANKVDQAAAPAPAAAPVIVEKKEGLSDTEKLLLLGAGALVVGAILSDNRKVEMNSGDRVVVSRDGAYELIKDDDALLRQPGSKVRTETFRDGSTRTTVSRPDGTKIVTILNSEMRVLRRVHVAEDGRETLLIDDTIAYEPVDVALLPEPRPLTPVTAEGDDDALRAALAYEAGIGRRFSLAQIRGIREVRALVPVIDLDAITFDTGSAAIKADQAKALARLGKIIQTYTSENPGEIFLIEGHTDAVGSAAYNLALSDRRAESVALALTEYFAVPPENLVVQGYGEQFLKVASEGDKRANRRASVRRITELMR